MASSSDYVEDINKYDIREVPNFPKYYATSCGRVISDKRGRLKFINGKIDKDGYRHLILKRDGKNHHVRLHRIIAKAFLGDPECESFVVAHKDGDLTDNDISNLKYCTQEENIQDKRKHGTHLIGSQVHNAKINEDIAAEIKRALLKGTIARLIAEDFGVSKHTVYNIKYENCWGHVKI